MNCIDDLNETKERWFEMDGGGRVMFRTVPASEYRKIQKLTTKHKVDFKKVEGTPARLEYDDVNLELQGELFWDAAIGSWNEFSFRHPETKALILCTPETCTKENKIILINCSRKFIAFANESMKKLDEEEKAQAEVAEKNSSPPLNG